jgi:hypothetical protein
MNHVHVMEQPMTTAEKVAGVVIAAILLAIFAAHYLH